MSKAPNILFLFPDQHRGDFLPYSQDILRKMGHDDMFINMPNIKKLMDRGAVFTDCITPSPVCAPARACLAMGSRYDKCRVPNNRYNFPTTSTSLYRFLRDSSYSVGGVGKFDLNKPEPFWGEDGFWQGLRDIGFTKGLDNAGKWDMIRSATDDSLQLDPYAKFLREKGVLKYYCDDFENNRHDSYYTGSIDIPIDTYCDNYVCQNGVDMINSFEDDKPWFLQVNFTGPHDPWDVLSSMVDKYRDINLPTPSLYDGDTDSINAVRQNYAAMIENIDDACGRLIDAISSRGELGNTIIIYSSDHGEMLGDRNMFGKSVPFRGSVHIPLIITGPQILHGVYDELVELQDIAGTICDFAGINDYDFTDSISLYSLVTTGKGAIRNVSVSGLDSGIAPTVNTGFQGDDKGESTNSKYMAVAQTTRHKLIKYSGEYYLYDRHEDVWETDNILGMEPEIAEMLIKHLPSVPVA